MKIETIFQTVYCVDHLLGFIIGLLSPLISTVAQEADIIDAVFRGKKLKPRKVVSLLENPRCTESVFLKCPSIYHASSSNGY